LCPTLSAQLRYSPKQNMSKTRPSPQLLIFAFYGMAVSILLIFHIRDYIAQSQSITRYATTDFLINYEGGFVRRGLLGQCLLGLADAHVIGPIEAIELLSVTSYLIFVCFYIIQLRAIRNIDWVPLFILLFSPALTLFPLNDGRAFERKEMLFLPSIVAHLLVYPTRNYRTYRLLSLGLVGVLGALYVLVHEGLFLLGIPVHLLLMWTRFRTSIAPPSDTSLPPTLQDTPTLRNQANDLSLNQFSLATTPPRKAVPAEPASLSIRTLESEALKPSLHRGTHHWLEGMAVLFQSSLLPLLAFVACVTCRGTESAARIACQAWEKHITDLSCDCLPHAFAWIGGTQTLEDYPPGMTSQCIWILLFSAMSLLTMYALHSCTRARSTTRGEGSPVIPLFFLLPLFFTIPLYIGALDWGRWFYFTSAVSTLCLLNQSVVADAERVFRCDSASGIAQVFGWLSGIFDSSTFRQIAILLLPLMVFIRIPHFPFFVFPPETFYSGVVPELFRLALHVTNRAWMILFG